MTNGALGEGGANFLNDRALCSRYPEGFKNFAWLLDPLILKDSLLGSGTGGQWRYIMHFWSIFGCCASFCMDRVYNILLDDKLIGTTKFEHADAPMGVVFGQINFIDILTPYDFIKSYCKTHKIDFDDDPGDKVISTRTIPTLKVTNDRGQEIKGLGNQISGMDSDIYELTIEQIPYPFYGEEFPNHVKDYENRFG